MADAITIAVVARNAGKTIERAIRSALDSGPHPILLVDDGSEDDTAAKAKKLAGSQLTLVPSVGSGVGAARQTALQSINTKYGMWLDADDEIMPERPSLFRDELSRGADLVFDSGRLVDSETEQDLGKLAIPSFIQPASNIVRCIERNWYPLLHAGFDVGFARSIGFDTNFLCAEDYDFLLRAIAQRARVTNLDKMSYRYHHAPNTISRDVRKTRAHVRKALEKHQLRDWQARLESAALKAAEIQIVLASSALYKNAPKEAMAFLAEAPPSDEVLPQYQLSVSFLKAYLGATALMMEQNWAEALLAIESLMTQHENSPEVWNNLGVCRKQVSHVDTARECFERALSLKPGYYDARQNIEALDALPVFITTHPFRRELGRDGY